MTTSNPKNRHFSYTFMVSVTTDLSKEVDLGSDICPVTWATLPHSYFLSYPPIHWNNIWRNWKLLFIDNNLRLSLRYYYDQPTFLIQQATFAIFSTCPWLPLLARRSTPLTRALTLVSPWSTCIWWWLLALYAPNILIAWAYRALLLQGFAFAYFIHVNLGFMSYFHVFFIDANKKSLNMCFLTFYRWIIGFCKNCLWNNSLIVNIIDINLALITFVLSKYL